MNHSSSGISDLERMAVQCLSGQGQGPVTRCTCGRRPLWPPASASNKQYLEEQRGKAVGGLDIVLRSFLAAASQRESICAVKDPGLELLWSWDNDTNYLLRLHTAPPNSPHINFIHSHLCVQLTSQSNSALPYAHNSCVFLFSALRNR